MADRLIDRIILGGILFSVCLSPWLFGSVEFYAIDLLTLLALVLLGLFLLKTTLAQETELFLTPLHWVLLASLVWGLVQLIPWPDTFLGGSLSGGRLTSDPAATKAAVVKFSVLFVYFFLAAQILRTHHRLSVFIHVLVLLGCAVAMVGILNKITFNGRILWFRESEFALNAFGPFVNRNHFAGFMELLVPLPLTLIMGRTLDRDKWLMYGFMATLMGVALVLSASRGGLMALVVQLICLPILARYGWRRAVSMTERNTKEAGPSKGHSAGRAGSPAVPLPPLRVLSGYVGGSVALAACIIGGVFWIGSEPVMSRLTVEDQFDASGPIVQQLRPSTWKNTLHMIQARPWSGHGLGAFGSAYPQYDTSTGTFSVDAAHNDYLQVVADMGIPGAILGLMFLLCFGTVVRTGISSPHPLERSVSLGCATGCIGILAHSLVDFNLQITATALMFLILLATLDTVPWRTRYLDQAELVHSPR